MNRTLLTSSIATRVAAGLAVAFGSLGVAHAQLAGGVSTVAAPLAGPGQSAAQAPVVPADSPLPSTVAVNMRAQTGPAIPDYVRGLIAQYDAGTLGGIQFPLANELYDDVRAIRGLQPQVLLKWLDALTLDPNPEAPHFGANADYTAYFGDGWDSDWQGDVVGSAPQFRGSGSAGWLWINHEYISNNDAALTSAPTGQHLTLAKWLKSAALLAGDPTANLWSQADLNTQVLFHKKNIGGSWVRIEKGTNGKWQLVKTALNRRYDATSDTVTRLTGTSLSSLSSGTDHLDGTGKDLSSGLLSGIAGDCSGGQTPWGTVVTAEENVQGYYGDLEACWTSQNAFVLNRGFDAGSNVAPTVAPTKSGDFGRVDQIQDRHNRDVYGYLVEIDVGLPGDQYYQPVAGGGDGRGHRKLGVFGRARWENVTFVTGADWKLVDGQPIVAYAADDRRSGRIFKFVSSAPYITGMTRGEVRGLMDSGRLYVSHFAGLDNLTGKTLLGGGVPTEAQPGIGQWLEVSVTSTDVAPNATALGAPGTTVGEALLDSEWNSIGGFPTNDDVLRSLFTVSAKLGVMELNRPEDLEWNPLDPSGSPKLYVAFTNNNGRNALDQDGVLFDPATHATVATARQDRTGGVWAMDEVDSANPAASMSFAYYAVWEGTGLLAQGLFDAANPDNLMLDSNGGVWFGTDGNVGTNGRSDALYLIDLASVPKNDDGKLTATARGFRVVAGPSDSEATGPALASDERTLFFNVQHPGENLVTYPTTWPQGF